MLVKVLFVPCVDVVIDPVLETLANSCVDDVGQPLTRQQVEVFLVRQVVHQLWVCLGLLKHTVDRYVFVLRAEDFKVFVRVDA